MTKKETKLFRIYKVSSDTLIENNLALDDDHYMQGELVNISNNQVFHKILDFYNSSDKKHIADSIIDVVVPPNVGKSKQKERDYKYIATNGFIFNGMPYKRLCSGSGQIRNNTVTFVHSKLYDYLFESLCCGLVPEDFGEDFNPAKFNAYFGLNMSGINFLKTPPRVCVIDDYEEILPHYEVDYILTKTDKTKAEDDKREKTVVSKNIIRCYYDEDKYRYDENNKLIQDVKPVPLNSFDGQGLMSPDYAKKIALELGYLNSDGTGYVPSEIIIRAPWVKGLLVNFDWKEYCRQHGVSKIKDSFGNEILLDNIDILLSKSQFKMWKIYAQKGGWNFYVDSMEKYNLRWGVVLPNKQYDDRYKAINYQYINALVLSDTDLDALCQRSIEKLTKLCSGDIETIFNTLLHIDDSEDQASKYESLLMKAIKKDNKLLQDRFIQSLIFNECRTKFRNAKIGKVLCRGNYQYIVSDPIAQVQHVIRAHAVNGNKDIKVTGLIPAYSVYSHYWNKQTEKPTEIVLMRSPLIDQSEVAVRTLEQSKEAMKWYRTIRSGIILSVHDLTALQCQGADFDGDRAANFIEPTLLKGAIKNPVPLLYPAATTQILGAITEDNLIEADVRGLNSKVGKYSNKSTSFYAKLVKYVTDSEEYKNLLKYIKVLGEIVGTEIDSIKTGIKPKLPSEWKTKCVPKMVDKQTRKSVDSYSEREKENIFRHNALVSDIRPYYMRYNYNYLDRKTKSTKKSFNFESYYNYGVSIDELVKLEDMDEKQRKTARKYLNWNPVIDSDCSMNKICHKFEVLEKNLKQNKVSTNVFKQYIGTKIFDSVIAKEVKLIFELYRKHRRTLTRLNNCDNANHNKTVSEKTKGEAEKLMLHIRRRLINVCGDDAFKIYDYCIKYCDAGFAWRVLDKLILQVIDPESGTTKPSEFFSINTEKEYSVSDQSIAVEESIIKKQKDLPEVQLPLKIFKEELNEIERLNDNTLEEIAFSFLIYSKMYPYKWLYKCDSLIYEIANNKSNGKRRKEQLRLLSQNNIIQFIAHKEKDKSKPKPVQTKFQVLCKKEDGDVVIEIYNPTSAVMYYRGYKGLATVCLRCASPIAKMGNRTKYCIDCAKKIKIEKNRKYREENRKNNVPFENCCPY